MSAKPKKCCSCIVADHLPVVTHGEEIVQANQHKYLGVHLDNKLCWNINVSGFALKSTIICIFFNNANDTNYPDLASTSVATPCHKTLLMVNYFRLARNVFLRG